MRWLMVVGAAVLQMSCVTRVQSVRRQMVAPLPVTPLLMVDDAHRAQLRLSGQFHPGPLQAVVTDSGLGAPIGQGTGDVMVRVSERVAAGGSLEFVPSSGAQYNQGFLGNREELGVGLRLAVHGMLVDTRFFALDVAANISLHGMPAAISTSAPLQPFGSVFVTQTTVIPGFSIAALPRLKTPIGSFFGLATFATNADIEAIGTRVTLNNGSTRDDYGGVGAYPVVMVGGGYAWSLPMGLGFHLQAAMPLTQAPIGYGFMFTAGLSMAFGEPPVTTPVRKREPAPFGPGPRPPTPPPEPVEPVAPPPPAPI